MSESYEAIFIIKITYKIGFRSSFFKNPTTTAQKIAQAATFFSLFLLAR